MAARVSSDDGESNKNPALERCLGVLRDAGNDSEQFAALLLVRTCPGEGGRTLEFGNKGNPFESWQGGHQSLLFFQQ